MDVALIPVVSAPQSVGSLLLHRTLLEWMDERMRLFGKVVQMHFFRVAAKYGFELAGYVGRPLYMCTAVAQPGRSCAADTAVPVDAWLLLQNGRKRSYLVLTLA